MSRSLVLACTATILALATGAQAATVDQASTRVGPGGGIEPVSGVEIASDNLAYDNGPTAPASDWVWIDDTETTNSATFEFAFSLAGFDRDTATLSGVWGVDNLGEVRLNGNLLAEFTSITTATFNNLSGNGAYGTSDSAFFNPGGNTLTFSLRDDPGAPASSNQAAFRATAIVEATPLPVPLPAGAPLVLAGLVALGALRLARRPG
jgi:hypothetical protein